jgi:phosphoenolpyruvate carboxykinase (ATP)
MTDARLDAQGLRPSGNVHSNLVVAELVEHAVRRGEGQLAEMGPLATVTAPHTGRSPDDKFIVRRPETESDIDWGDVNRPMEPTHFDALLADVQAHLGASDELFVQDLFCGADPAYRLAVRYVSPSAWHMAFVRNMFIRPELAELASFAPNFTVLHAPEMQADPLRHGTRSATFIVLDLARRMILIGGTRYAGELKKAMFTVMNYYLPKQGVLSMHCSANIGPSGDAALFFGLSGTGKTTLSADPRRSLIGDDEHGWANDGVFNFEGGCYAKAINLSAESEPDIHRTTQMFGTILENVVLDQETRRPRFADSSVTENTRLSYPLHYIPNFAPSGRGGHPKHIRGFVRRPSPPRPPLARAGDVLLPLRLHGEARRHGAWSEGTHGHLLRLLRSGVPRVASHEVRRDARSADRCARLPRLARQHRLERWPLRGRQADEDRVHALDGSRDPRRDAG